MTSSYHSTPYNQFFIADLRVNYIPHVVVVIIVVAKSEAKQSGMLGLVLLDVKDVFLASFSLFMATALTLLVKVVIIIVEAMHHAFAFYLLLFVQYFWILGVWMTSISCILLNIAEIMIRCDLLGLLRCFSLSLSLASFKSLLAHISCSRDYMRLALLQR